MQKILVVVDMQNDFIDGSLGTDEAQNIVPKVLKKMQTYKDAREEIIFTMDTHFENYLDTNEGKNLPIKHCIRGTNGWKIQTDIDKFAGKIFEKNTFGSVECAQYIRQGSYNEIEIIGLCTDICVISNAFLIKAYVPEAKIIIDSSCCAGVTKESHQNALESMKSCQIIIR